MNCGSCWKMGVNCGDRCRYTRMDYTVVIQSVDTFVRVEGDTPLLGFKVVIDVGRSVVTHCELRKDQVSGMINL